AGGGAVAQRFDPRRDLGREVAAEPLAPPLLGGDVLDQADRPARGVDAHRRDAGDYRNGPCGDQRSVPGERGEPHFEGGADCRGEPDPPRPEREGRRHDEEHVEHRGRERRAREGGIPGDDAGLQEVDERHVHETAVDAHQRGESGRPAGRPEDRRGTQPVGGGEPEVRLVGLRGGDDEGQQEVQRAGNRDADEAEQANEADAAQALRVDRLARGLGAGARHAAAGTHIGSSPTTIVASSQSDGLARKRSRFDPLRAIHYLRLRTPAAAFLRTTGGGRRRTRVALRMDFPRIKRLPPYVFNVVGDLKLQARRAGEDIVDFSMGNPDGPSPPHVVEKLVEAVRKPANHRYSVSRGIYKLRVAICDWYRRRFAVDLDPDAEAIVTMGSKEGIGHLALDRKSTRLNS